MKIVVCMKRVPTSDAKIKPAAGSCWIDPAGVEFDLNPFDEYAIEEALSIREGAGEGEVIILCLGTGDAQKEIRKALAMGADRGVLIEDPEAATRDAGAVSQALAAQLRELAPDIVLMGKLGIDRDQAQTGPRVATLLEMPCVTDCAKIEISASGARAEREVEGGREVIELPLPAVFTAEKGLNEPRYASLKGIMAAKKKPIDKVAAEIPEAAIEILSFESPPERPAGRILGEGIEAIPELVRLLKEEAKVL